MGDPATWLMPWLVVAGLGALHGLNPAGGWPLAAAWGRRALGPIVAGHVVSIGAVAGLAVLGPGLGAIDRRVLMAGAGVLLIGLVLRQARGQAPRAAPAGLALWSFIVSTAHGAGLMLVPALVPLCLADTPARAITASGSLGLALAAVGVHLLAMLGATTLAAAAARVVCARAASARPRGWWGGDRAACHGSAGDASRAGRQ